MVRVREGASSSIIRGISYPDHSSAIFMKPAGSRDDDDTEKNRWIVHQILYVVELKMDDSACSSFAVKVIPQGRGGVGAAAPLATVDESCFTQRNDERYGPLGQELMYVVGHVLWGRAALGLRLPSRLPFAVVAGKRFNAKKLSSSPPKDTLRWFHGHLIVPHECGGRFFFSVDGFGAFDERTSGSMACLRT